MANIRTRFPEEVLKSSLADGNKPDAALAAAVLTDEIQKFDPSQERDESGKWTSGGGGTSEGRSSNAPSKQQVATASEALPGPLKSALGRDSKLFAQSQLRGDLTDVVDLLGMHGFNTEKIYDVIQPTASLWDQMRGVKPKGPKLEGKAAIDKIVHMLKTPAGIKRFSSFRGF